MKIVKLTEEACEALRKLGVSFEEIGVTSPTSEKSVPTNTPLQIETLRPTGQTTPANPCDNFKAIGAENRERELSILLKNGITLEHEHHTCYRTSKGCRVIISVKNHPNPPGKWFLGAPKSLLTQSPHTALILVCKEGDQYLDFVIPPAELQNLIYTQTESGGNLKFNVRRDNGRYRLYRPKKRDKLDITGFLHCYDPLRSIYD